MSTNIYEEKKKFNIIDALIIFLLVVLILVVIFRAQLISLFNDTGTKREVEISFVCEAIPNEISASVESGTKLTWVEADKYVGTLTVTEEPTDATLYYYDENGVLRANTSTTDKTFKGRINGTAISSNGCYIGGTDFLASGMTVTLTSGKVQFTALITSVEFK